MSSASSPPARSASRWEWSWVALCLALQTGLELHSSIVHPVLVDEGSHVFSGLLYLQAGVTDFYHVNPPLGKALSAAPVLLHPGLVWPKFAPDLPAAERLVRWPAAFQWANREHYQELTLLARLPLFLLSAGAGLIVWSWARALFGPRSAACALLLWTMNPLNLAWSSAATTDAAATFFMLLACWLVWRQGRGPGFLPWLAWSSALGAALLCKFSAWILLPLLIVYRVLTVWHANRWHGAATVVTSLAAIAWAMFLVNLAFGFNGTGRPLGAYSFRSFFLAGRHDGLPGNRFRDSWIGALPTPLPRNYLEGFDLQKTHSDYGLHNYLLGEWKHGGWWYYYLVAAAVKEPLGNVLLAAVAITMSLTHRRFRANWPDELLINGAPLLVFALISSQTGINGHYRYQLPAVPFVCISVGRVGQLLAPASAAKAWKKRLAFAALAAALSWNAVSVLAIHPHYLAYFNEAAGGPARGADYLLESNLDFGQDLLRLRDWAAEHPPARPLRLACYCGADPSLYGLEKEPAWIPRGQALEPGWYALSISYVQGKDGWLNDDSGRRVYFPAQSFRLFRSVIPTARVGFSIVIYHIPPGTPAPRAR
jgi:4-amino-4-deoxy-L-arabinose transferase-like glycosyltransferase